MQNQALTEKAKELRRNATPSERLLWSRLRAKRVGVKFRRQHPIGDHIVDFVCVARRLVVEIDGASHGETACEDRQREAVLGGQGYRVLRFTDWEVMMTLEDVVKRIKETL